MNTYQGPSEGPQESSATGGSAHGATAVFFDPTGRRRRRHRLLAAIFAFFLVAGIGIYGVQAYQSPEQSTLTLGPDITKEEAGTDAPVVGQGPLERVVKVDRSAGLAGLDPFTGVQLTKFTPEQAQAIGDAPYAIERFGYAQNTSHTISLTFDDGPDPIVTPKLLNVLASNHVPATFFVQGRNAVKSPEIVQRMAREGHAVGIHTMTHPDLNEEPAWRERVELVGTDRMLRDLTGRAAGIWRMPYTSPDEELEKKSIEPFLRAQRMGITHATYDFDTNDWDHDAQPGATVDDIPLPDLSSGQNVTMLLHDAGGPNREMSVAYVQRLISYARANGYTFHTMPQVNPTIAEANAPVQATLADKATTFVADLMFDLPNHVMRLLFFLAVLFMIIFGGVNCALAVWRYRRRSRIQWPNPAELAVPTSVVLAAYNEEPVIERTLRTVLASDFPVAEVVVVDDGSKDGTASVVAAMAAQDHRVRLITQPNAGKAAALNRAVAEAVGDVVVTLDADTIITPSTVGNLVRHFALDEDGRLGGVAGVVRVGNRERNLLTRWQALEYVTQIGLDRAAQDAIGGISIIPGACAAWRKEAILGVGGYSTSTLAEDCDLALNMHRAGWRVTQDDEAIAYTEAPETVDDLLKQRERWTYGTLQAVFKNRDMMFRRHHKALGWYVLPNYVASILIPLIFLPFVLIMAFIVVQNDGPAMLLTYFGFFLAVQFGLTAVGIRLMNERWKHLLMVPIYRIVFEPLRAYLLYTSVHLAVQGGLMGWNKLERSGSMDDHEGVSPTSGPESSEKSDQSDRLAIESARTDDRAEARR